MFTLSDVIISRIFVAKNQATLHQYLSALISQNIFNTTD